MSTERRAVGSGQWAVGVRGATAYCLLATAAFALVALRPSAQTQQPAADDRGRAVYVKWCAGCHGDQGRGDGPAARHLLPRPRDFTRAVYQIRTTANGELPRGADLRRVVDDGMPGTSMPGWRATLSGQDREAVVRYVRSFSTAFAGTEPAALDFGGDPGGAQAAIDSGRALYRGIECWKCHGDAGRGDGPSAPRLEDDWNFPIRAANLTENWLFNGGGDVQDIYRRLLTGLDGTPMPSFTSTVEGGQYTFADLWRIAHYVRSLSPEDPPRPADVVRAALVAALPAAPDDSAWAAVDRFWVPLAGQVIVRPRWFAPTVSGVWVQAVHDGGSLVLRVSWTDPSESPDSTWNPWRSRVATHMAHDDSAAAADPAPRPDRVVVQFPMRVPTGMDRPYFLAGSPDEAVYLWQWESAPRAAVEATARGLDAVSPLAAASDSLRAAAVYDRGEWRVQFTRSLTTADSTDRLQFATGRAIPMALFAWDGSNGEAGTRGAVGSWISIYLAEPGGAGTFVWPLVMTLATAGLVLVVIRRAQHAARAAGTAGQSTIRTPDTAEAV